MKNFARHITSIQTICRKKGPLTTVRQLIRHNKYHNTSLLLQSARTSEAVKNGSRSTQSPPPVAASSSSSSSPPVIIVGGGPVGLFLSILLSDYHVPHILLERQSATSRFRHPQAHFINTRSMELFRTIPASTTSSTSTLSTPSTLFDRIQSAMAPVRHWQSFRYGTVIHDRNPLAEIVHPVDRPLQSDADANGQLLPALLQQPYGNTTTIPTDTTTTTSTTDTNGRTSTSSDLSPCTVGHLAQHTLGRILYDTAIEKCQIPLSPPTLTTETKDTTTTTVTTSAILYETSVERIEWMDRSNEASPMLRVVTKKNHHTEHPTVQEYYTDLVIAADGAHSTVRQQLWKVDDDKVTDDEDMEQHLINVHVTIPMDIAHEIHTQHDNYAMLYSVYTSEIIAMIVCHTIGEYVIQIPYFPPFQTIEHDFTPEKVLSHMDTIFGYPNIAQQCHIHSIAPWTMTSWIAKQYYQLSPSTKSSSSSSSSKSKSSPLHTHHHSPTDAGVVLVGDAAHVFPPAGGFGMNTGLQDVHNIAWKIAAYRHHMSNVSSSSSPPSLNQLWTLPQILHSYELERRPVAQQNAALSIRNYERLLEVTKTLYLNAQHPALLCKLLEYSPLPLWVQQDIFRTLLKTALYPLSWLRSTTTNTTDSDNSNSTHHNTSTDWLSYAQHIRNNLRQILDQGAGLPLLFPRFEIGFTYQLDTADAWPKTATSTTNDTMPDQPKLGVGRLVPHLNVYVISNNDDQFPNLKLVHDDTTPSRPFSLPPLISTTDLPTQMRNSSDDTHPNFVLLYISTQCSDTALPMSDSITQCTKICRAIQQRIGGISVQLAILLKQSYSDERQVSDSRPKKKRKTLVLLEPNVIRPSAFSFYTPISNRASSIHPYYVLIRPDGHISGIVRTSEKNPESNDVNKKMIDQLLEKVS